MTSTEKPNLPSVTDSETSHSQCSESTEVSTHKRTLDTRFFLIFSTICWCTLPAGWSLTCTSSILPVVGEDLGEPASESIVSVYIVASMASIPLSAMLAEPLAIGRLNAVLTSLSIFSFGCVICGSARSVHWLVGGRAVQGIGGGGLLLYPSIWLADMTSLHNRGVMSGVLSMIYMLSLATGPLLGGSLATIGAWRWIFFMNLIVCIMAAAFVVMLTNLNSGLTGPFVWENMKKLDWPCGILLSAGAVMMGIALSCAGTAFAWNSAGVLGPLMTGMIFIGMAVVFDFKYPSYHSVIPISVFSNLTSVSGHVQHLLNSFIQILIIYYLPIYHQGCRRSTLLRSGIDALVFTIPSGVGAFVSGAVLSHFPAFWRLQCCIGWLTMVIGCGLMTLLNFDSPPSHFIAFPLIVAIGSGILQTTTEWPVTYNMPSVDHNKALIFCKYVQSLGLLGFAVGESLLQSSLKQRLLPIALPMSSYPLLNDIQSMFDSIIDPITSMALQVAFGNSILAVWHAILGVAIVGLLSCVLMRRTGT